MKDNSILIIGGGFAGLAAGIYGQMNGYKTRIFEMHDLPGGLCTSWKRKGYTIDGCIHWLVGSSPLSSMHSFWQETGIVPGREFIDPEEYMRFETNDGRILIFYTNIYRLEKHLLEFSPADKDPIHDFINGIKMCLPFDTPSKMVPFSKRIKSYLELAEIMISQGTKMKKWMKTTAAEFVSRFRDQALKEAILRMWFPDFSMFFILYMFACMNRRNAGYPIGGSLPMSDALEKRYTSLGGQIHYDKKVEKILVEQNQAVGIQLADGTCHYAARVISGADGYATIFKMLEGKYADEKTREPYEKWPVFPSILYVGIGVNRTFHDEPITVSGFSFPLINPVEIGGEEISRLPVHLYNQDTTLAPPGKTTVAVMLDSNYEYWKNLSSDRKAYLKKKEEVAEKVITQLEQRFPGISTTVEMVDVATPLTFERYTGNWKGCFEGWQITPGNSHTLMKRMSQTLPGLKNFYMCGQWVEPGGGLPTSIMSGRRLMKAICREDHKKFRTQSN